MKSGKPHIHHLPINDVTTLGAFAYELQQEAEARGEVLPPAARLHIGEPSFRTPEHIRLAAIEANRTCQWLSCWTAASCHCHGRHRRNPISFAGNGWRW